MNEQRSVQIIKTGLELAYPNGFYYKPPDAIRKGMEVKKPFDIFYWYRGNLCGIEVKFVRDFKKFYFTKVEDHQIFYLKKIVKNRGFGYIAIHMWSKGRVSKISFIDVMDWCHWEEVCKKRSLTWKELCLDSHVNFVLDVKNARIKYKEENRFYSCASVDFNETYLIGE